ncbi:ubiquinol-cytochrome c reductase iron-sulfur subunit [Persicitalea sp.]|uniref:QcrA and Rieske domain-containing protein n=1 Tax=Persicitalea sp. TaxID=3100273 RepID=UPI003593FE11
METKEKNTVNRGEFLRSLGLSTSALMAFYCMGTTLSSCSTKDDDPAPATPTTPGGTAAVTGTTMGSGINFNIDLNAYKAKDLKKEGEFDIFGDTIVIATANKKYVALSKACTHQGTTVNYRSASNDILCPNHGSQFKLDGTVQKGPAASPLTVFKTTLSADGNSLNVKA